ncbi:STAS domain-containing protein [candidate division KSB1 bacterium]
MGVKEKIIEDIAVLTISGKMMGGKETNEIHEKVKSLIADEIKKVVIDLSKVRWMNSQGIGILMACHSSLTNNDGKMKIAGATEKVKSILMITQVLKIFDNYETADRAVSVFLE